MKRILDAGGKILRNTSGCHGHRDNFSYRYLGALKTYQAFPPINPLLKTLQQKSSEEHSHLCKAMLFRTVNEMGTA